MEQNEALLDACNALHENEGGAAIQILMEALPSFPEVARSGIVLPVIRKAAGRSQIGRWVFQRTHPRPQLVEVLNAPLTWVYGSRVGIWNVVEVTNTPAFGARDSRFLIVTGRGPGIVSSRLAPIITDLATERNCTSDLILSGFAFFDLREPAAAPREQSWSAREFCDNVIALGNSLAMSEAVNLAGRDYIMRLAPQVLRPTVRMAQQEFEAIEQEIGFVTNREIAFDVFQAIQTGSDGLDEMTEEAPILAEYRHRGKPIEIELDDTLLGIEEYKKVAGAYTQAVRRQRVEEWDRRRRVYEEWAMGTVREWHTLRRMEPADRDRYSTMIHWAVNFETASREPLDPPRRVNGTERLATLPQFVVDNLAWWTLAKHRIDIVSAEPDFQPWMDSYLIDAFFRAQPQSEREKDLKEFFDRWVREWRPIALHALDAALRKNGLTLDDIAVEQTMFKVLRKTNHTITLGLLHVRDASLDPQPTTSDAGITLYCSHFGARKETYVSADEAQRAAIDTLDAAMNGLTVEAEAIIEALSLDSGQAISRLLNRLAERFQKDGAERELTSIRDEAVAKDPLLKCRLAKKLQNLRDAPGIIRLAEELRAEIGSVPDVRAWALYLALEAVRHVIESLGSGENRLQMLLWSELQFTPGFHRHTAADLESIVALSSLTPWQILGAVNKTGPKRSVVNGILKMLQSSYTVDTLLKDEAEFRTRYSSYANRCIAVDGPPPLSEEAHECSAPNCFRGWKEVCYYLALGDAAAALGLLLLPVSDNPCRDSLMDALKKLDTHDIHDSFPDLHGQRRRLIAEVKPYLAKGDIVSLDFVISKIRVTVSACLDEAAAAYTAAALRDGEHGVGWLRLAALKWSLGSYRDALRYLLGPAPAVSLLAARFPLALAVRLAGGQIHAHCERGQQWTLSDGMSLNIESDYVSGTLVIDAVSADGKARKVGSCVVSGLPPVDAKMLVEFFRRYDASLFRSAGSRSFKDWMLLLQVPSLPSTGGLAVACEQGAEMAVLAGGVYLGVPSTMRFGGAQNSPSSPNQSLGSDVISLLHW